MIHVAGALAGIETLPFRPLRDLLDAGPFLVLAPHPSDESLGCGGLIAAATKAGAAPFVLIVTDGAGSHPNSRAYPPARLRRVRQNETQEAAACLGLPADRIGFLGLPDTESPMAGPAFDATVTMVESLAHRMGIRTILSTWAHDPDADHESAHWIAAAAAREAKLRHLAYPVWGWTLPPGAALPGTPSGWRLDITAQLPRKRRAIAAHRTQHGGLIVDDPQGFQLSPEFLALFDRPFETFLDVTAPG